MKKLYQLLVLLIAMVAINSSCTEEEYYKVDHGYISYSIKDPWGFPVRYHIYFILYENGKAYLEYEGLNYRDVPYHISGNKIIFTSSTYMNPRFYGTMYGTNFLAIKITSYNIENEVGTVNIYTSATNSPKEADRWVLLVGDCKLQ